MRIREWFADNDKAATATACKRRNRFLDTGDILNRGLDRLNRKLRSSNLKRIREKRSSAGSRFRIEKHRSTRHVRCNILEKLEILRAHCRFDICKSGNIAAGFREALNKFFTEGIGDIGEYNRYRLGALSKCSIDDGGMRHDYIGMQLEQFPGNRPRPFGSGRSPPVFDPQIFVCPPQLFNTLLECADRSLTVLVVLVERQRHGDQTFALTWLPEGCRGYRQRGKTRRTEKIASPH